MLNLSESKSNELTKSKSEEFFYFVELKINACSRILI